jgi:hypothetical protein
VTALAAASLVDVELLSLCSASPIALPALRLSAAQHIDARAEEKLLYRHAQ